ncbi:hypothetical protein KI387_026147, partial [Taxus chinensis]
MRSKEDVDWVDVGVFDFVDEIGKSFEFIWSWSVFKNSSKDEVYVGEEDDVDMVTIVNVIGVCISVERGFRIDVKDGSNVIGGGRIDV